MFIYEMVWARFAIWKLNFKQRGSQMLGIQMFTVT
jgi:hypothetical protein